MWVVIGVVLSMLIMAGSFSAIEYDWAGAHLARQRKRLTDDERDSYRIETTRKVDPWTPLNFVCQWSVYQPKIKKPLKSGASASAVDYAAAESRAIEDAEAWIVTQVKLARPEKYEPNVRKVTGAELVEKKRLESLSFSEEEPKSAKASKVRLW